MEQMLFKISSGDTDFPEFFEDSAENLHVPNQGTVYMRVPVGRTRAWGISSEILVALASGGAFATVYQVICKYIGRHEWRELVLEKGGTKITIKGHSLPEERALMRELFPEALKETKSGGSPEDIT